MMDDVLVEIDAGRMGVARHFMLRAGMEHGMAGPPGAAAMGAHGGSAQPAACSPTWAQPSADGRTVWVACNRSNELVEIDVASWTSRRRIPAGEGVYNLAVTRDGRLLLATNKRGQSVSVIDPSTGRELAKIPTARRNPSGVVVSSDDRYAFVTVEGVGSEPGTVEVLDLASLTRVASVDVGQQAGGIDFWKTEAPRGR
jgi:YVTN family beta-propeller protein